MAYLARQPPGTSMRAVDLAKATDTPVHYLSKVLRKLVGHGLLLASKGHGGGFSLAMSPEHIRFADILRATGFAATPNRCAFGWGTCNPAQPCPLHPAWSKLNEALSNWATATTIADTLPAVAPRRGRRRVGT